MDLPLSSSPPPARELLLTGALFDAQWARENRFVSELVAPGDLDGRVTAWAERFERTSRAAVAATKEMLNARHGDLLEAAMTREERWCVELFGSEDSVKALRAFTERGAN